jgi:hypothetical protein
MTPADLNLAATIVRALNMVAQASREWLAAKREEVLPKQEDKDSSQR